MLSSHPKPKIRVGILFGGKSAEHEVSLQSAKSILQAIDKQKFEPVLIAIDKAGKWHYGISHEALLSGDTAKIAKALTDVAPATVLPDSGTNSLAIASGSGHSDLALDVIFPVLHGPMGEDGSVQGFLELANLPYVGSGVLGSAIGMDKDVTKRLLRDADITVADFIVLRSAGLTGEQTEATVQKLGLPLFVKPANMGSSIGVSKVETADGLVPTVREALRFDTKVLVEQAIVGSEIECAVLGNDNPQASVIGQVIPQNSFYSYEAKYIDEDGAVLEIPARIPSGVAEKARQLAIKTFTTLGCEGMARVDMFACQDGSIVVNEINTIPGFTKISMYPKLWEASGLPYTQLIDRLIELAIERFERRKQLSTSYDNHL